MSRLKGSMYQHTLWPPGAHVWLSSRSRDSGCTFVCVCGPSGQWNSSLCLAGLHVSCLFPNHLDIYCFSSHNHCNICFICLSDFHENVLLLYLHFWRYLSDDILLFAFSINSCVKNHRKAQQCITFTALSYWNWIIIWQHLCTEGSYSLLKVVQRVLLPVQNDSACYDVTIFPLSSTYTVNAFSVFFSVFCSLC